MKYAWKLEWSSLETGIPTEAVIIGGSLPEALDDNGLEIDLHAERLYFTTEGEECYFAGLSMLGVVL